MGVRGARRAPGHELGRGERGARALQPGERPAAQLRFELGQDAAAPPPHRHRLGQRVAGRGGREHAVRRPGSRPHAAEAAGPAAAERDREKADREADGDRVPPPRRLADGAGGARGLPAGRGAGGALRK